jgi:putative transposase
MGRSRSAVYKHFQRAKLKEARAALAVSLAKEVRQVEPRVGCRKVHLRVLPQLEQEGMRVGRDKFFAILKDEDMLVERKHKYVHTTYSKHEYAVAPNRIKDLQVTGPNQVFVADITYLTTRTGHVYLFLVTDLYSRKIVGYHLSRNLMHYGAIHALEMALKGVKNPRGIIHHSDRGCQYCCHEMLHFLDSAGMVPSMTDADHCYQNAVAERVNGILKDEFLLDTVLLSFEIAQVIVKDAIGIYNRIRLHGSLNYRTPGEVYGIAA